MEDFSSSPAEKRPTPKEEDSDEKTNDFASTWFNLLERQKTDLEEEEDEVPLTRWQKIKKSFQKLFKQQLLPIENTIEPVPKLAQNANKQNEKVDLLDIDDKNEAWQTIPDPTEEIAVDLRPKPELQPISGAQLPPENVSQPLEIASGGEVEPEPVEEESSYVEGSNRPMPAQEIIVNLNRPPETTNLEEPSKEPKEKNLPHSHKEPLGAAAAIGTVLVDQLSRRRDRKLRREHKRDMQTIKKELGKDETADSVVEITKNVREQPDQKAAKAPEVAQSISLEQDVARRNYFETTEQTATFFKPEILTRPHLPEEISPEVVLEQVEAAAEKDIPIEAAFEKRHEIKDEPDDKRRKIEAGGSHSSQSIDRVADLAIATAEITPKIQIKTTAKGLAKPAKYMYKQAITSGLWAALIALAFLAVLMIIT